MAFLTSGPRRRRLVDLDVGIVAAVGSSAAFSTSGPFAKSLLSSGWAPVTLVTARVLIAGLVLLPAGLHAARGRWGTVGRQWWTVVGVALTGVAGCQVAYFNAVTRMPVSIALLIEYLGIVLVVLWVWLRTRVPPHRLTVVGIALAVVGLLLVLDVLGGGGVDLVGLLWALSAAVGLAAYFVLLADADPRLPSVTLASLGMLVGAAALVIFAWVSGTGIEMSTRSVTMAGRTVSWWAAVAELAVIAAALAYLLGAIGTRRLGATVGSVVGLTEVLFAVFFAWVLLGELPGPWQLVGGALVVAGIVAVRLGERRTTDFPAQAPVP